MTFLPSSFFKQGMNTLFKLNKHVPLAIKRPFILSLLQQVFISAIDDGDMDFLRGKIIKIQITDNDTEMYVGFCHRRFELHRPLPADVCISGKLEEFVYLAARYEDPDTLFFQRRLMIEGDTELGLEFKNILDAIDDDTLPTVVKRGIALLAHKLSHLSS